VGCFPPWSSMETWINISTYRSWRKSYYHLPVRHLGILLCTRMKNVRPHRARTLVNFVETEGIEHMEWPAVSPDMNPIENLWSEITRTLDASANQPTNLAELRQAVIDACMASSAPSSPGNPD
jgi:transposase